MPFLDGGNWNVKSVVGVGMSAGRSDVMLVQFLLSKVTPWLAQGGLMDKEYILVQDGIFGAHALEATIAYQRSSKKMIVDGRVSPFRHQTGGWDDTHLWTLVDLLNDYCRMVNGYAVNDFSMTPFEFHQAMAFMPWDGDSCPELSLCLFAASMANTQAA